MDSYVNEPHAGDAKADLFEQHVRTECERAETLAARIGVENVAPYKRRIRRAWVEAELPSRCPDAWARIWRAVAASSADRVMSRRERRFHAALPTVVTVYRGFSGEGARGWSWTLDRAVAADFAVRYDESDGAGDSGEPRVCTVQVERDAIIACLLVGGEEEVIIDPDRIDWSSARIESAGPTPTIWAWAAGQSGGPGARMAIGRKPR